MSFTSVVRLASRTIPMALIVLLAACATGPAPEKGIVDAATLDDGEGIVFGTIEAKYYNSKGKQLTGNAAPEIEYEVFYGTADNIGVQRAFSGFADSIPGNTRQPEIFFAIKLPAGEYSMFKLYRPFTGTTGVIVSDVRFTVESQKATYIGALQVDFRATRGLFGEERVGEKVAFKIADDAESAAKIYKERNPEVSHPLQTSLMKIRKIK